MHRTSVFRFLAVLSLSTACTPDETVDEADPAAERPGPTRALAAARASSPSGTIALVDTRGWTADLDVELDVTASSTATEMCLSNNRFCKRWQPVADTATVRIKRKVQAQTIQARFRDADGNESDVATVNVRFDGRGPAYTDATLTSSTGSIHLEWDAFTDATSGVDAYYITGMEGRRAQRCSVGDVLWEGDANDTEATLDGLAAGPFTVRLCAVDVAGNLGGSRMMQGEPTGESAPPEVNEVALDDGAETTRTRSVYIYSDVDDDSGVSEMCVSETATSADGCRAWTDYADIAEHELSGGSESKTVRVWYRDPHGNVSDAGYDSILFDRNAPSNGELAGEVDDDGVSLSWSGFEDDLSGISEYVVVWAEAFAPDSCAEGTEVYRGTDTSVTVDDLDYGLQGFRVCAADEAGNLSTGDRLRVELEAPIVPPTVDTFQLVGGATTTCDKRAYLELEATGAAEVTRMCFSEDPTSCTTWRYFDSEPDHLMSSGYEDKTLYAWVKDVDGNESESPAQLDFEYVECAPEIRLSSNEINLGPICGGTDTTTLTIYNDGDDDLTVSGARIVNDGLANWSVDRSTLPWVIASGDSHGVELDATTGTATLHLTTDVTGSTTMEVPLSATLDAAPTIDGSSLPDGEIIEVGSSEDFEVGLSDDSTSTALTVSWESDVDGEMSEGAGESDDTASFAWDGISQTAGTHTITATVTDACGQTDSTTFTVCQDEGFSADQLDLSTWNFEGDANYDAANGWVEITTPQRYQGGSAYQTAATVSSGEIDISALIYVSGGSGADGITVTALDADRMTSFLGGLGGGIGYSGLPGWTVEVDTWYNRGTDPTRQDHVSVHIDGDVRSPEVWADLPEMEDGSWHELRVRAVGTRFTVWVDDTIYIDDNIPALTDFDAYVGFSGATGGATNYHLIDSLEVRGSTCE